MSEARRDPTLDDIHLELVEKTHSAVKEVPEALARLTKAAAETRSATRLLRMESRKVTRASSPNLVLPQTRPLPKITTKTGGSAK